ncbi:ligase [Pseudomonas taiwanensis]|uniref:O-antigen ligase family protein n=1 Tax=Pseudomonas taiwanensis TaxID=470150 RepID=UPI0015BBDC43|nr:O-antigen ligase family protein [Pseudomonas taiwanensis]NWL80736.1 ligase [Pseudomonas taiwanensis]
MTAMQNKSGLTHGSTSAEWWTRGSDWLIKIVLPIGWIALLTGMFWIGDRPYYHKLFYSLLAAPALLALIAGRGLLKPLLRSPIVIVFLLFSAYTLTTLLWSSTDDPFSSLGKRPVYVLFLFFSAGLLAMKAPSRLQTSVKISAVMASLAGATFLVLFLHAGATGRFAGYGALYNPLLSSHVFGFFMAYWAAYWFLQKNIFDPLSLISLFILAALILATGSRTPLVAVGSCLLWLSIANWNRRSLVVLVTAVFTGALLLALYPDILIGRGVSFRPEIWAKAWQQILEAPWLGHGYDAPMKIWISAHDYAMADPHNVWLAVLYYCGAIGLVLWVTLYVVAFRFAWRHREQPWVMISSALLVFGLAASMTEGGSFLSRPKEHWFLIWIPMALMVSAELIDRFKSTSK